MRICTGYRKPAFASSPFTDHGAAQTWQRTFSLQISTNQPIDVFNYGDMQRDFTFVDDIVQGVIAALDRPPTGDVPHRLYNLGNHRAEKLKDFIAAIEAALGKKAVINLLPMQMGDVPATYADIDASRRDLGFDPQVTIAEGIPRFVEWYKAHHDQQSRFVVPVAS